MLCKAKTKSGNRCTRQAGDNGFCGQHDPRTPEEKEKAIKELEKQKERYQDVLDVIEKTCEVLSWKFIIESEDDKNWRYATVRAEKTFNIQSSIFGEEVKGLFHVIIEDKVKVSLTLISSYSYGLDELHRAIMNELGRLPWNESSNKKKPPPGLDTVLNLINRFHVVANQLKRRHSNRETLRIKDEYDVQDLLHALLKINSHDIRSEESAPSKAGAASRLDFLLKNEKIVIEVKMASNTLTDKKIGEQLIVDIDRYKAHPDCEKLVCFVYDPDQCIGNPIGLEKDLARKEENLEVIVIVAPK